MYTNRLRKDADAGLLAALSEAEREFSRRGGRERLLRRNELMSRAVGAGYCAEQIAQALGVTATEIGSWIPSPGTGRSFTVSSVGFSDE